MEKGQQVVISPKKSNVLVFEVDGKKVFTKNDVTVKNPGGNVAGEFERVFDSFFNQYFKQSFLRSSGIFDYLENPKAYKSNFAAGSKGGKSFGKSVGYRWIVDAKVEIE